ncbi:MAG: efflux RND transporter permease subunit [SAR324 cluster bacterium]|nr:efflux RND transporter permease subunit [SAR324 cluster bacterium]
MIRWMAGHKVAANLLMVIILFAGLMGIMNIKQEVFPEMELDFVVVGVPYPGATPEEIEKSILLPIEDALGGINGIKKITGNAKEGQGSFRIEILNGADKDEVFEDIKTALDGLTSLPEDAEELQIQLPRIRREVLNITIYGEAPARSLIEQAQIVRNYLLSHPDITQVDIEQRRGFEMTVQISKSSLQQHSLTLNQVSNIIKKANLDLPGGKIKTSGGDILIRTKEKSYTVVEFANIPIIYSEQGILRLGDIANISDGFEESDIRTSFNGLPAESIEVFRVGKQTPTDVSRAVRSMIEELNDQMPSSIKLEIVNDRSLVLQDRIDLLMKNLWLGLILVFITLAMFLRIDLAFWIMMGIPISFAGGMILMPILDTSINMISLFAFILVLGIVVDDAIVVGENIFAHQEMDKSSSIAAIDGATEVSSPVLITILTTIAAFIPMYFIPGTTGNIFSNIPNVLIVVLLFSLAEVMFILPGHLSHLNRIISFFLAPIGKIIEQPRRFLSSGMVWFSQNTYRKTLERIIEFRYSFLALGLVFIMVCIGLSIGGHMRFTFFPTIERDRVILTAKMPFGTPVNISKDIEKKMLSSALGLLKEYEAELGKTVHDGVYSNVGRGGSNNASVRVYLKPLKERGFPANEFSRKWRKKMGVVPGIESLKIRSGWRMGSTYDIDLQLSHPDPTVLFGIVEEFKDKFSEYPGVKNIEDSTEDGKREVQLKLTPEGLTLGLDTLELTQQVRSAFQGVEVLKFLRNSDELSLKLVLPLEERKYLRDLEDLVIITPNGVNLPLAQVAELKYGQSFSAIRRINGRRIVSVRALVDTEVTNTAEVVRSLKNSLLPETIMQNPELQYSFEGARRAQTNTMEGVKKGGVIALVLIFCLLALQFRSYFQPIIIMVAIPFGMVGAILGHLLLGYDLSIISVLGIVALTGIVVNDSLILVDFINRSHEKGAAVFEAVVESGVRRFRPILLTTLTTFFGLMPMLFETSIQARFLIPMAISLAFGVLFSTFIILYLVPVLYTILEDTRLLTENLKQRIGIKREIV